MLNDDVEKWVPLMLDTEAAIDLEVERYQQAVQFQHTLPSRQRGACFIPDALLYVLGCTREGSDGEKSATGTDLLPAVQAALPRLLVAVAGQIPLNIGDLHALLSGMLDRGVWRNCLDTWDSAYALAATLCFFLDTDATSDLTLISDDERINLLQILNEWLQPTRAWKSLPYEEVVVSMLFGAPWCHFALPSAEAVTASSSISAKKLLCAAIIREQPPFQPGLCPEIATAVDGELLPQGMGL